MDLDISSGWFSTIVEELRRVSKRSKNRQYKLLVVVQDYFTRVVSQIGENISILEILNGIQNVTNFIFEAVSIITRLREANYEDLDLTDVVPNFERTLETLVAHLIRSAENDSGCLIDIEYINRLLCCFLNIVTVNYNSWSYDTTIKPSCLVILYIYEQRLSQSEKKQLAEVVLAYMDGLLQALNNCGDYWCQNFILAIILNLVKLQQIGQQRRLMSELFPNLNRKEQSNLLIDDSPNYETLLNKLNFFPQSEKTISSVEIFNLFIGERNFLKHSEINKHWINFSHKSKRMHFKADMDSDFEFKQFDLNIELSQIESVCISQFPKESLSGNFYVLHIHLKSDIASISNELLSHTETNCRSVHVVYEDFDVANEAIKKMGYTSHDFDAENELCCYPELLWLWSSVYQKSLLDKNKDFGPALSQDSEQNECIEDEILESYQNDESENLSPLVRFVRNKRSSNFNMENCHKEREESENLSPVVRGVRNKLSSSFNMENCHQESEESENLSPLVRCVRNKRSSNFNMENCHKEREESENLSPLVRCVRNKRRFNCNMENSQKESEESENLSPHVRCFGNKRMFNCNMENSQKENEESRNLSPLVRCNQNEDSFGLNMENCRNENEESENLSPLIRSLESCRSKENEFPVNPIPHVLFQQRITVDTSSESQEIYPATPNTSLLLQPYLPEDRLNGSDNEAVRFILTSTTAESCFEDPFPRSLRRIIMEGVESTIPTYPSEYPPDQLSLTFQEGVEPFIHQPELPGPCIPTSEESERYIRTPEKPGPCILTPEESGHYIRTQDESGHYIRTPDESGSCIRTPDESGSCIRTPEHTDHYIRTPEHAEHYIRTPEKSEHYIRTPEKSEHYIRTREKPGPCIRTPDKSGPCTLTPDKSGPCTLTPDKSGPCIRTPKRPGPCIRTPKRLGPCIRAPKTPGPCIQTPDKSGPLIRTPKGSGSCIRTPEELEYICSEVHQSNVRQTVLKVSNRVPCYMQNKEKCTLSQGTDPYIPRWIREMNIKQVVRPKRSRPVQSKMKTLCRPLPVRKVSTKTEKNRNVERLKKKVIRLENKLHKLHSGIDQLELELTVTREELLEEERAAGDN